jgi:multidrug efflux pump subunit AcrA (membrane-fusion protein)
MRGMERPEKRIGMRHHLSETGMRTLRTAAAALALSIVISGAVWAQAGAARGPAGGGPAGGRPASAQGGPGGASGGNPGAGTEDPLDRLVGTVEISERAVTTTTAGRLRPAATVSHPAATAGVVTSVSAVVGRSVRAGTPLFTVEREDAVGRFVPHVVRARIDGVVAEVLVRENNEIRAGENGVTLIDTSSLVLTALVSDKDAFRLRVGSEVEGAAAGGPAVRGTLASLTPEPDYQTGLFTITVRFPASSGLHAGQFVTVELPIETERGIFLRQDQLFRRYGRFFVWIVTEENTLQAREVTTGPAYGEMILIRGGLVPGDRYLRELTGREREGMPVAGTGR